MIVIKLAGALIVSVLIALGTARSAFAAKHLHVGVYNFAPLVFYENGEAKGLFVDVLKDIAAKEQWSLEFVFGSWAQCLERLENGQIDILVSIAATSERETKFDFTREYLFLDWGVVYKRKGVRINNVLELAGKKVAALNGSVYTGELLDVCDKFGVKIDLRLVSEYDKVLDLLGIGDVDAGVCTNVYGTMLEDKYAVERTNIVFAPIKIRIASLKGRYDEILAPIDRVVSSLKQDKSSAYYALYDKWMGLAGREGLPAWALWASISLLAGFLAMAGFILVLRRAVESRTSELNKTVGILSESEERFRLAIQEAPFPIMIHAENGDVLALSRTWSEISGYSLQDIPTTGDWTERAYGSRQEQILASFDTLYSLEMRREEGEHEVVCADGTKRIWAFASAPLGRMNGVRTVITMALDVTERKAAEKTLRNSEERFREVVEGTDNLITQVDSSGVFLYVNPVARVVFGLEPKDCIGRNAFDFTHEDDREATGRAFQWWLTNRMPHATFDNRQVSTTGEVRHMSWTIDLHYDDDGKPTVIDGIAQDMTERRRMQEVMVQTEKMMSVGGLVAGMAHEINNPLGGVLQNLQNIRRRVSPEFPANAAAAREAGCSLDSLKNYLEARQIFEFLDSAIEAGKRAARIVSNMLEFSRKADPVFKKVSANDLLDKAVELAASDYDLKKKYDFKVVRIERNYAPDLPDLACSHTEIEQVVFNLLKNAAQAMKHKEYTQSPPTITLRTALEGDMVALEVADNGPGMDEATRKRVFEPFFTTKGVGEGTGLGLSVSYFIITENHRGAFEVESEPGKGSRFIIRLPLNLREDVAPDALSVTH